MSSMLGEDPQETARALQGALEAMTKQLAQVKTTVRRGKRVIAAIVASLLIDVAVTIGVSIAVHQASDASGKATATVTQVHAANLEGCRLNNVRLARQQAAIDSILTPAGKAAHSAAARAYFARARGKIAIAWKPRNCKAAYRLGK